MMTVRVLGLGNVLMGDDGFGPYAARVMDAFYEMPEGVEVIDVGTPGLDLTPFLLDADVAIFLDTIKVAGEPGDVRTFTRPEILKHAPQPRLSPHDPGIKEALLTVEAAGAGPSDVLFIGVVPQSVEMGVHLSEPVRAAVARAIGVAIAELERHGLRAVPRPVPRQPDTWWEREGVGAIAG